MVGSTVARGALNSPERSLTNSVCAGVDSGKVGGIDVALELAAAFVDSLMTVNGEGAYLASNSRPNISPKKKTLLKLSFHKHGRF